MNIQINDIRQLPIIIPSEEQLRKYKTLFDEIIVFKKQEFNSIIDEITSENKIKTKEFQLNKLVNKLYGI